MSWLEARSVRGKSVALALWAIQLAIGWRIGVGEQAAFLMHLGRGHQRKGFVRRLAQVSEGLGSLSGTLRGNGDYWQGLGSE